MAPLGADSGSPLAGGLDEHLAFLGFALTMFLFPNTPGAKSPLATKNSKKDGSFGWMELHRRIRETRRVDEARSRDGEGRS